MRNLEREATVITSVCQGNEYHILCTIYLQPWTASWRPYSVNLGAEVDRHGVVRCDRRRISATRHRDPSIPTCETFVGGIKHLGERAYDGPVQLPEDTAPFTTSQYTPFASDVLNDLDQADDPILIATDPEEPTKR